MGPRVRSWRSSFGALVVSGVLLGPTAVTQAQEVVTDTIREAPPRPRFALALGMGVTWDSTGFVDRDVATMPSFAVSAEAHGTTWGVALGLLTVSGSGRFPFKDSPVDRVGLDAALTLRPLGAIAPADPLMPPVARYLRGVFRSLTLAVGPGYEEVAAGSLSVGRFGLRAGASLDLAWLTDARGSVFKVRATGRRFWGPERTLGMESIQDTRMDLGIAGAVDF